MRFTTWFTLVVLSCQISAGDSFDVEGGWQGVVDTPLGSLRIVLHIQQGHQGLVATMDSPDQQAQNLPVTEISFDGKSLRFESKPLGLSYKGTVTDDGRISGKMKQLGQTHRVKFSRHHVERLARPQTPNPPFSYVVEEVGLENKRLGTHLAGSLTIPSNVRALVVLISGSGQQDRDSQIAGHRPFRVIADHFANNQIAAFRYDDRGVGGSTGSLAEATSRSFADELVPVVRYLRSRFDVPVGLVGHSDGGVIGGLVAQQVDVDFLILMAAPAISGREVLRDQNKALFSKMGYNEEDLQMRLSIQQGVFDVLLDAPKDLSRHLKRTWKENGKDQLQKLGFPRNWRHYKAGIDHPWLTNMLITDAGDIYTSLDIPILGVFGDLDLQVDADKNSQALSRITGTEVVIVPGVNHLFQPAETGLPAEYFSIEQTISNEVLELITRWVIQNS